MQPITCSDTNETFTDYSEYLKSKHWSLKKKEFYASSRFLGGCAACNSKVNLNVHHMTYKNLGNEPLEDLTCLCGKCHMKIHGISEEPKLEVKPKKKKKDKNKNKPVVQPKENVEFVRLQPYKLASGSFCKCCKTPKHDITAYPVDEVGKYHPKEQHKPSNFVNVCLRCHYELIMFRQDTKSKKNLLELIQRYNLKSKNWLM